MAPERKKTWTVIVSVATVVGVLLTFAGPIARAFDTIAQHPMDDRYVLRADLSAMGNTLGQKIDRLTDALCDPKVHKPRVCDSNVTDNASVTQAGGRRP